MLNIAEYLRNAVYQSSEGWVIELSMRRSTKRLHSFWKTPTKVLYRKQNQNYDNSIRYIIIAAFLPHFSLEVIYFFIEGMVSFQLLKARIKNHIHHIIIYSNPQQLALIAFILLRTDAV